MHMSEQIRNSDDPNIQFMLREYEKGIAEQEQAKKSGFRLNDYCWNCKKFFKKLRWKLCDNGYISYWCKDCY
jgi:hypothetical protein